MLSYVDDCVYSYTYEEPGKWLVGTLGRILHMNLLGYEHWFMYIRISQLRDHYISGDQARYYTSIFENYPDQSNKIQCSLSCDIRM